MSFNFKMVISPGTKGETGNTGDRGPQGLQGDTGPSGAPWDQWIDEGWSLLDEEMEPRLFARLDALQHNGTSYIATESHTASAETEPGVGVDWETVWDIIAERGGQGLPGVDGEDGADGTDPGVLFNWVPGTGTGDPGEGNIQANNASLGAATSLFVSKENRSGDDIGGWLVLLDSSTSTNKGNITLSDTVGNTQAILQLLSISNNTDHVTLSVNNHAGAFSLPSGPVSFQFSRTGNEGDGAGDFSGPGSATTGNFVSFADSSGKIGADSGVAPGDLFDGDYASLDNLPTLGDSAALDVGTTAGTVAAGDHTHVAADVTDLGDSATRAVASTAEFLSAQSTRVLGASETWAGGAFVTLTDAASVAVDMSSGFNFSVAISGNRTLANPSNAKVGQTGVVKVAATGASRTINIASDWIDPTDRSWPLTIAQDATARIYYQVEASDEIVVIGVLEEV